MLRDDMYERKPIFAIAKPVTSLRLMSWVTLPMALFSLQNYVLVWNLRIACMISKHVNRELSWLKLLSIWNHSPKSGTFDHHLKNKLSSKIGAAHSSIAWVADECNQPSLWSDQIFCREHYLYQYHFDVGFSNLCIGWPNTNHDVMRE